jgi:Cys-tRNA(Pro) deacylase
MTLSPVSHFLTKNEIAHREFTHAGIIHSLEHAAEQRGQRPEQIVRSILFRLNQGEYAMVLMAGPRQISWKKLRKHFEQSRLTMASADEMLAVTGYERGAVSPFGIPQPLPILVDESVMAESEISLGSGRRGTTIIMQSADLLTALGKGVVVGGWS